MDVDADRALLTSVAHEQVAGSGVPVSDLASRTGVDPPDLDAALERLAGQGFLEVGDGVVTVTPEGMAEVETST